MAANGSRRTQQRGQGGRILEKEVLAELAELAEEVVRGANDQKGTMSKWSQCLDPALGRMELRNGGGDSPDNFRFG